MDVAVYFKQSCSEVQLRLADIRTFEVLEVQHAIFAVLNCGLHSLHESVKRLQLKHLSTAAQKMCNNLRSSEVR